MIVVLLRLDGCSLSVSLKACYLLSPASQWGLRCLRLTFRSDPSVLPRKEPCAKLVRDLGGIDFRNLRSNHRKCFFLRKWMEHLFWILRLFRDEFGGFYVKNTSSFGIKTFEMIPCLKHLAGPGFVKVSEVEATQRLNSSLEQVEFGGKWSEKTSSPCIKGGLEQPLIYFDFGGWPC